MQGVTEERTAPYWGTAREHRRWQRSSAPRAFGKLRLCLGVSDAAQGCKMYCNDLTCQSTPAPKLLAQCGKTPKQQMFPSVVCVISTNKALLLHQLQSYLVHSVTRML